MKVKNILTKLLSILLILGMLFSLVPEIGTTDTYAATTTTLGELSAGQCVYFGTWNGSSIKWRVLNPSTSDYGTTGTLLISEYVLDCSSVCFDKSSPYSNEWEGSDAESWCNTFYNTNLTETERKKVYSSSKTDNLYNSATYNYGFKSGSMKNDKVFFLSAEESERYFKYDSVRKAYDISSRDVARHWWLRSPYASYTNYAGLVSDNGNVSYGTVYINRGARPALVLNPNSSISLESIGNYVLVTETVPDAPTSLTATATGKNTVKLSWKAPESNGGATISSYKAEYKTGEGDWTSVTIKTSDVKTEDDALTAEISGLTEYTEYTFRISAVNVAGTSDPSTESDPVTTWIEPETPTGVKVEAGEESGTLKLTWTKPFGGNPDITHYNLYIDGELKDDVIGGDLTEYIITGLTDGVNYKIKLTAVNDAGESDKEQSAELTGRPRTIPDAPKISEIKAGNKQAFITIEAPSSDGGATITEYRVYVNGELNRTVGAKELTDIAINGFTNSENCEVYVTAVNIVGESEKSNVKSVKAGMPRPPENVTVTPGNCQVKVTYDTAKSNGNKITGYNIYVDGKVKTTVDGDALEAVVEGLINGKKYEIQVSTLSPAGESLLSDPVTLRIGSPTTPVIESVNLGEDSVTLSWSESDGNGLLMKGYNVYLNNEVKTKTDEDVRNATIDGLEKGTQYTIEVVAENIAGEGDKSQAYTFIMGSPQTPSNVVVTGEDSALKVTWDETDGNGSIVTGYRVYLNGAVYAETDAETFETTLRDLANGVEYDVCVSAVNSYGEGFKSPEITCIPYTYSFAPTNVIAEATGNETAKLTWFAPLNDGGMPVLGYTVCDADDAEVVITGTSAIISGLTPDTEYTFSVIAKNQAGDSPAAEANTITTWTVPDAPILTKAESGNSTAHLTWKAAEKTGGSDIQYYNVYVNGVKNNRVPLTSYEYTVEDLSNGTYYEFAVTAVNVIGESVKSTAETVCIGIPTIPVITSVVAGDKWARFEWSPSVENVYEITGYKIYLDGKPYVVTNADDSYKIPNLENGRTYTIGLTAMCGKGETAMSNVVTVTPGTLPAPTNLKAIVDTASASLTWDSVTGADSYVIFANGEQVKEAETGEAILTGLLNKKYVIEVATKNVHGIGGMSESVTIEPWTVPDAPVLTGLVSTVDGFEVTFTKPKSNGKDIERYEVYANGEKVEESAENTVIVSGLTSGETYTVTVKAVSSAGESAASDEALIRIGTPGKTKINSVENSNTEIVVTYDEPEQNGGAITQYNIYIDVAKQDGIATYSNDTIVVQSDTTSAVVDGLETGVAYSVTVEAVNTVGTGPLSDPYITVPGATSAPILQTVIGGDKSAEIAWKVPLEGAETVVKYYIYVNDEKCGEATDLEYVIDNLQNGIEYEISVTAINGVGESGRSNKISVIPCTTPEAPCEVVATATSSTTATLSWKAPESNGGADITGYTVKGDGEIILGEDGFSAEISGLESGKTYTFTVTAENECGEGKTATSNEVVTFSVPTSPAIILLKTGNGTVIVAEIDEPEYNGGTDILGYNVYYKAGRDGELTKANDELVTEFPYIIGGLTNGITYYINIEAVNEVGKSNMSAVSAAQPTGSSVIEAPGVPRNVTATGQNASIKVTWDAPIFDGNASIWGYNVYLDGVLHSTSHVDGNEYIITGLTNGFEYDVCVSAVNKAGEGDKSAEVTAMPLKPAVVNVPGAIADESFKFTVDKDQQNAILVWDAPTDDGGAEIEGYTLYVNGMPYITDEPITDTTYEFPVLFEQAYTIAVAAYNSVGTGAKTNAIVVAYNLNIDTDGDGEADVNVDTDGDGSADVNIDTDGDLVPDEKIDEDGNGIPDEDENGSGDDSDNPGGGDVDNPDGDGGNSGGGDDSDNPSNPGGDTDNPDTDNPDGGSGDGDSGSGTPGEGDGENGDGGSDSENPDNPSDTPSETAPTAPVITSAVSDGISKIKVVWTAEKAEDEDVAGYNVYVNGEKVSEGQTDLFYEISDADSTTEYKVYVTAVNSDGEESGKSNIWTAKLNLNMDMDGDGEADAGIDSDGNGESDDTEDKIVKISGTVGFAGTTFDADVKLVDNRGITVASATAGDGEDFEVSVTITAGNETDELYSLVISGKNSTVTTITDISLSDGDISLGKLDIYIGDVNGDGKVNLMDAALIKSAASMDTDARDLNGDGRVNLMDAALVKGRVGMTNVNKSYNDIKIGF